MTVLSIVLAAVVFDAFNRCSDPPQLERHARCFAEDVEFYHDTGGVTWTREGMLEGTRRHACGQVTRVRSDGHRAAHGSDGGMASLSLLFNHSWNGP